MGKETSTERSLTKAELERKAAYESLVEQYAEQGYRKHDLTISVLQANLQAIGLALPLIVVFSVAFFILHSAGSLSVNATDLLIVPIAFIALVVVHEGIHGLVWGFFAENRWKSVSFGFIVRYLTPYCTCNEPLPRHAYVVGALAPTVVLGVLPALIGLGTGSGIWLAIGCLMILGGGGDLAIALKLLRFRPASNDVLYVDHPYECGMTAFVR